jgi:TonB family protein
LPAPSAAEPAPAEAVPLEVSAGVTPTATADSTQADFSLRRRPIWMMAAASLATTAILVMVWALFLRRPSTPALPVAAMPATGQPTFISAPEAAAPVVLKPSAAQARSHQTSSTSTPALQPASGISVEFGPRTVVAADKLPTSAKPSESSETAVTVPDAPQINTAELAPPAMIASITAMPTLQAPVSNLTPGVLVRQVQPNYPSQAIPLRLQGAVVLRGLVGTDGKVRNLKALSGHPVLAQAAMDAVRKWQYEPYKLNGKPVPMETEITVNFKLP